MRIDNNWPIYKYVQSRGILTDVSVPKVMGILNVTPDSFFEGSRYTVTEQAVRRAVEMKEEGADIIDIGGMSTRPGASEISVEEECDRVLPVLRGVRKELPGILISVDTVHGTLVRKAADEGADWINDISAGRIDKDMLPAVAKAELPYILMHMQGRPDTMQRNPTYENVVREVLDFFVERLEILHELGIKDVLIDPGFGFGKTVDHNYDILANLDVFRQFQRPLVAGISRKSMINKVLEISPEEALHGTGVLHFAALKHGANILRAHDVREAKQVISLFEKYAERLEEGQ